MYEMKQISIGPPKSCNFLGASPPNPHRGFAPGPRRGPWPARPDPQPKKTPSAKKRWRRPCNMMLKTDCFYYPFFK